MSEFEDLEAAKLAIEGMRVLADSLCGQADKFAEDDGEGKPMIDYVEKLGGPNGPKAAAIMRAMVQAANSHESADDMPERMYAFLKENHARMVAAGGPTQRMKDALALYNRTVKVEG